MKILVINGPNINMLGIREPGIYGKNTFADLLVLLQNTAKELGITEVLAGNLGLANVAREMGFEIGPAEACVTPVHVKAGVNQASNIAVALREEYHIFCSVVIYPVIPPGMVIFRIIPTAAHTLEDVERTLAAFRDIKERLDRGEFDKEMPNMALLK